MAATQDDTANLVVSISADVSKLTTAMEKLSKTVADNMGKAQQSVGAFNDNAQRGLQKTADVAQRTQRAVGAQASNLGAQFQDIAVQLQSGTSAMTIALQQGTQIGQVLAQAGQQGGTAIGALVGAFKNLFTAANLVPIAIIAIGGAIYQAFSTGKKSIDDTIKDLKDLNEIAKTIGAEPLQLIIETKLDAAQAQQNIDKIKKQLQDAIAEAGAGPSIFSRAVDWVKSFAPVDDAIDKVTEAIGHLNVAFAETMVDPAAMDEVLQLTKQWQAELGSGDVATSIATLETLDKRLANLADSTYPDVADAARKTREELRKFQENTQPGLLKNQDASIDAMRKQSELTTENTEKTKIYNKQMEILAKFGEKHLTDIQKLTNAWTSADAAAQTAAQHQAVAAAAMAAQDQLHADALLEQASDTLSFLKKWEGFRAQAYQDMGRDKKFRVGFGSDTATQGKLQKVTVTPSTQVTPAEAEDDLKRRVLELSEFFSKELGGNVWRDFTEGQRLAFIDTAYNFGQAHKAVQKLVALIKSGASNSEIATAIKGLGGDPERRKQAAEAFGGGAFKTTESLQELVTAKKEDLALTKEEIAINQQYGEGTAEAAGQIARRRAEQEALNKATKDGHEPSAEDIALAKQVGDAAYEAARAKQEEAIQTNNLKQMKKLKEDIDKQELKTADELNKQRQQTAATLAQFGTSFITSFVSGLESGKSATEALRDSLKSLADQLLQMILNKTLITLFESLLGAPPSSGSFLFGRETGGMIGGAGGSKRGGYSPYAFIGAPRMATGGFVGVGPGEFPTILHRGEVVIPAALVRQSMGMSSGGSSGSGETRIQVGDVSITTQLNGTGDVKGDTEKGKQMGRSLLAMVQTEIARQSRPGGLLTASGSAGRVGR